MGGTGCCWASNILGANSSKIVKNALPVHEIVQESRHVPVGLFIVFSPRLKGSRTHGHFHRVHGALTSNPSRHLPDLQDDELRRPEGREPDDNIEDPLVDIVLGHRRPVAFDQIRLIGASALEGPFAEEAVHEVAYARPDLRPERLAVGLENRPTRPPEDALFEEERQASHRDVLPF